MILKKKLRELILTGCVAWQACSSAANAAAKSTTGGGSARLPQVVTVLSSFSKTNPWRIAVVSSFVMGVSWFLRGLVREASLADRDDLTWLWAHYERYPWARRRALLLLSFQLWASRILYRQDHETWPTHSAELFERGVLCLGPLYMKLAQVASSQQLLFKPWVRCLVQSSNKKTKESLQRGLEMWDYGLKLAHSIGGVEQYKEKYAKDLQAVDRLMLVVDKMDTNEAKQWKDLVATAKTKIFIRKNFGDTTNRNFMNGDHDIVVADEFRYEDFLTATTSGNDDTEPETEEAVSNIPDDKEWLEMMSQLQKSDDSVPALDENE